MSYLYPKVAHGKNFFLINSFSYYCKYKTNIPVSIVPLYIHEESKALSEVLSLWDDDIIIKNHS